MTERRLRAFEQRQGVRLPEDYRLFLREAGNGGAGPYYGLLPLEKWHDAMLEYLPDYLARPSPLRPGMPPDADWEEILGCPWEELFQGTLALAHQGCSYYALLVGTGTNRGRVVYVNLDRCGVPYFVHHTDFLSWYEHWLDELLWGYETSWFGFGLPGQESEMLAVLDSTASSIEFREEALQTLLKIPQLSKRTLTALQTTLRDVSPVVRARSVYLLAKHLVTEATTAIELLLQDPDFSVRKAALEALKTMPETAWQPAARMLLNDRSREVVFRALCFLKDDGALRTDDVVPLFYSANPKIRENAVWASGAIAEHFELPEQLLVDPNSQVRRYAIRWVGSHGDRRWVPLLLERLRQETEWELRRSLIGALGHLGDSEAFPALAELTEHDDDFLRQDAARALGQLGDQRAIPVLQRLLNDHTKPARKDDRGWVSIRNVRSIADTAREALKQLQ